MNRIFDKVKKTHEAFDRSLVGAEAFYEMVIDQYSTKNIMPQYPLHLNIDITNQCMGKCFFCISDAIPYRKTIDIANPNNICKLADDIKHNRIPILLSLLGGEPMLYPIKCKEYLSLFSSTEVDVSILSNLSYRFDKDHVDVLNMISQHNSRHVQTSIDSLNLEHHNFLRKGSNLKLILANIRRLQGIGIDVRINVTISEYNYLDIYDVVKFIADEHIHGVHINPVLPHGRAQGKVNVNTVFNVIETLLDISSSSEYNGIPEHSITYPAELLPILMLDSKYNDVMDYLKLSEQSMGNQITSNNYVCTLSDDGILTSGWIVSGHESITNLSITEAFQNLCKRSPLNLPQCRACGFLTICPRENMYSRNCMLEELKNKIDFIINNSYRPSELEKARNLLDQSLMKRTGITSVVISMTSECNGNCTFCQVNGSHSDRGGRFSDKDIINYLDDTQHIVQITGGEPLLRKTETLDLITALKSSGNIINLLTNYSLADDDLINALSHILTPLDAVQVSIYGHNSLLHKSISGRDDWELLNLLIQKSAEKGLPLRGNLTLTEGNALFCKEIVKYYHELGIKDICVNALLRRGRARSMVTEQYVYKYIIAVHEVLADEKTYGVSVSIPTELFRALSNIERSFGKTVINAVSSEIITDDNIYIHHTGEVRSGFANEPLGTIYNTRISEITARQYLRKLTKTECVHCTQYNNCISVGDFSSMFRDIGNFNLSQCEYSDNNTSQFV